MSPAPEGARRIGRYALHGVLASGGMATVHVGRLAGDVGFARTVAIKRLHAQYAEDPEFVSMFTDEARLAGRLRHPNIVPVTDVIAADGEVLIVMDYVQGETLSRLVRSATANRERVPATVAGAILYDALEGLHAAHESRDERGQHLGIVHRDISPQNIIVGVDGIARVLDFGVAKARGRSQVTRDGQLKGKLSYMAPEQLYGEEVVPATDVFAAGIVLWEALTGQRLFAGDNEGETVMRIVKRDIPPPSSVEGVSAAYDAVVMKALQREAGDRYASAREMAVAVAAAAPKAESHEVAAWVEQVAAESLAARRDLISGLESIRLRSVRPSSPDVRTIAAPTSRRRMLTIAGVAIAAVAAVTVASSHSKQEPSASSSTASAPSAVPGPEATTSTATPDQGARVPTITHTVASTTKAPATSAPPHSAPPTASGLTTAAPAPPPATAKPRIPDLL